MIDGVSTHTLGKPFLSRCDEFILDITGIDVSIAVRGKVKGMSSGSVLLERR